LANEGTYFVFGDHAINKPMNPDDWDDLFNDTEGVILDHHYYQAWNQNSSADDFCSEYEKNAALADNIKYDVWIGEWSLGTDNCALWLDGFNQGIGAPQSEC
jgi:glucan 1,3-beta-glucosidase